MSTTTPVSVTAPAIPGKAKPKALKKTTIKGVKPVKTHPGVALMIKAAIVTLKERNGSSVQAMKKYIQANYKVDIDRLSPFIKKHLKSATAKGMLIQTKGNGASGSFKLSKADKEKKKVVKVKKTIKKTATGEKKIIKKKKPTGDKKVKKDAKKLKLKSPSDKKKPKKMTGEKTHKKAAKPTGEKKIKKEKTSIKKTSGTKVMKAKKSEKVKKVKAPAMKKGSVSKVMKIKKADKK